MNDHPEIAWWAAAGPHHGGIEPARIIRLVNPAFAAPATVTHDSTATPTSTKRRTTHMNRRTTLAVAISALAAAWLPQGPAGAHNAAHFFLPNGTCRDVGSNKDAPIVGAGNPNQSPGSNNLPGQLDLIPGNGDQYGARWAAEHSPRLLPGSCP